MFANKQDEQVICHVSRHRSMAVRTYKHVTDDVCRAASESIQGKIVKPQDYTKCHSERKENSVVGSKVVDEDSD